MLKIYQHVHRGLRQVPYLGRSLHLVWQAARWWVIIWAGLLGAQGCLPVATVYLSRVVVDRLVIVLGQGTDWQSIQHLLLPMGFMAVVLIVTELLRGLSTWVRTVLGELVRDQITSLVHQQSAAIDFAFYESPDYYDRLYRVRSDASFRPLMLLEQVGDLLQSGITLIAMVGVLLPFGLWLPIALLVSALPSLYTVLHYNQRQHRWWLQRTPEERRAFYYDWLLTEGETAAEMRLFDVSHHFQALYRSLRHRIRKERLTIAQQQSMAEFAASLAALVVTGVAIAWIGWQALQGQRTLGDLALFYQAFNQGQGVMRSVLQS
ncbi:MAG: ABC transporter ATP-binding protein, partial [Cyanobacteria bacterium]|nr:ABC transporter ATP-binding protein [Cyanobacteriota bacterium]